MIAFTINDSDRVCDGVLFLVKIQVFFVKWQLRILVLVAQGLSQE